MYTWQILEKNSQYALYEFFNLHNIWQFHKPLEKSTDEEAFNQFLESLRVCSVQERSETEYHASIPPERIGFVFMFGRSNCEQWNDYILVFGFINGMEWTYSSLHLCFCDYVQYIDLWHQTQTRHI